MLYRTIRISLLKNGFKLQNKNRDNFSFVIIIVIDTIIAVSLTKNDDSI